MTADNRETYRWKERVELLQLTSQPPNHYVDPFEEIPNDDSCDRESRLYFMYLRHLAWFGQTIDDDSRRAPRVNSAYRWTRLLLDYSVDCTFISEIAEKDPRFYEVVTETESGDRQLKIRVTGDRREKYGTPVEKPQSWRKVLACFDACGCNVQQLTPIELELALVVFDWWQDKPRFAQWLFVRPEVLRRIEHFLLQRYCWSLLKMFRWALRACLATNESAPEGVKLTSPIGSYRAFKRFRAAAVGLPLRMWGLAMIGFLSTFAVDALQNMIWFGPWLMTLLVGLVAAGVSWGLAYVDVYKQHGGEISKRLAMRRAVGLFCRLWGFACVFACLAILLLFAAWPDGLFFDNPEIQVEGETLTKMDAYRQHHPLRVLTGSLSDGSADQVQAFWNSVCQWLIASFTLGSLSAFLGITVQWLWEDKSAIEPI